MVLLVGIPIGFDLSVTTISDIQMVESYIFRVFFFCIYFLILIISSSL